MELSTERFFLELIYQNILIVCHVFLPFENCEIPE